MGEFKRYQIGGQKKRKSCPSCRAINLASAYCCLACNKVLSPKREFSISDIKIPISFPLVLVLVVCLKGVFSFTKSWVGEMEANVTNNLMLTKFHVSVRDSIDKKKAGRGGLDSDEPNEISLLTE